MHNPRVRTQLVATCLLLGACTSEHSPAGDLGTFKLKPSQGERAVQRDAGGSEREDAGRPVDEKDASTREDAGRPAAEKDAGRDTKTTRDAGMALDAGNTNTNAGTTQAPSAWTMLAYDLASTYNNSAETRLTKQNASSLRMRFTVDVGQAIQGAPLLVDDKLYFSAGHDISAHDLSSGKLIWQHAVSSSDGVDTPMTNSLAYDNGTIYAHTGASELVAMNAVDGTLIWETVRLHSDDDPYARGYSSPIIVGDKLIIGRSVDKERTASQVQDFRGSLWAFDKKNGKELWRVYTAGEKENGAGIWSTPSADEGQGLVYVTTASSLTRPVGMNSNALLAVDFTTGQLQFSRQTRTDLAGQDFGANPILFEAQLNGQLTRLMAAGSKAGWVHTMNRLDGTLAWELSLGPGSASGDRGVYVNGAWTGKHLLFAYNDGRQGQSAATLLAVDPQDGKLIWQRKLDADVIGRITVANGVGFVGVGSKLEVFDADSGDMLSSIDTGGPTVAGTASIANGVVAFGTGAKFLDHDDAASGKLFVLEVP